MSQKIARYNVWGYRPEDPHRGVYRTNSGRFVRYEDYKRLADRVAELEQIVETRELIEKAIAK